jgi:hypothetical protein
LRQHGLNNTPFHAGLCGFLAMTQVQESGFLSPLLNHLAAK